jgi:hypothetical protein
MGMRLMDSASITQVLAEMFRLERQADVLRARLAAAEPKTAIDALGVAIREAQRRTDRAARVLELTSITSILAGMKGPEAIDLLIDVLASEDPGARHSAGTALAHIGYERFKEVALGVERAVARLKPESPALRELPYVLMELPEAGVARLLSRFLSHSEAEVVAAGLEACIEVGDPAVLGAVRALERDPRTVEVEPDDEEEDDTSPVLVTLGELAREARELLAPDGPGASECDREHAGSKKR